MTTQGPDGLPSGTVTFLFTDIEQSTETLRALGADRYREALEAHRTILREALLSHGGFEVDAQGDAFLAVFVRARDAVRTAAEAQQRLTEHTWPEDRELRVRMGIHSCEAESTTQGYVGVGVHRGARICAAGHGGQVLLSATTHGLLEAEDTGFEVVDLGEHRLKGLSGRSRLFQLALEGLTRDFAPLRTLESFGPSGGAPAGLFARERGRKVAVALATAAALIFGGWWILRPTPPVPIARFSLNFEEGQLPSGVSMRFTQDGLGLVYVGPGTDDQVSQLWMRRWADLEATPIPGTDGAATFALSPDGREVAFVAGLPGPLRVVSLEGGAPRTLLDRAYGVWEWADDGTLYIGGLPARLARIPSTGQGEADVEILSELRGQEQAHGGFSLLPGGRAGVFDVSYSGGAGLSEVWTLDLGSMERRLLIRGSRPRYTPTGHLLFGTAGGALMAVPFDVRRGELAGTPTQVASDLWTPDPYRVVDYALSSDGTLVYSSGGEGAPAGTRELVWVDRSGAATPVDPGWRFSPPGANYGWSLSPTGESVALTSVVDGNTDIWIKRLPDGAPRRLTLDRAADRYPVWSPDGQYVTYVRDSSGNSDVWQGRSDGSGTPELILDDERSLLQPRWSRDGSWMVFRSASTAPDTGARDILGFRPGLDEAAVPLVATATFAEQGPALSPDGRWLAYSSNETGRSEVYVRAFPDGGVTVPISMEGGSSPLWAKSGSEIFFVDAERTLVAAEIDPSSELRVVQRESLFRIGTEYLLGSLSDFYDIHPDDQRFIMGRWAGTLLGSDRGAVVVVQNFFAELDGLGNE